MPIRFGIVGYGTGGRLFHAPYLIASDACEVIGVVTGSEARADQARADIPNVQIFGSLAALLDAGVDAVVITTPPGTRRELVEEAISRGVHVVADKPFAPTMAVGRSLAEQAQSAGVLLNVFHNRRQDPDIVTARDIITAGHLGTIQRLDLRCDQDDPNSLEGGPAGGLLRDLGSHVVDQALHLLGPAQSVAAYLDWTDLPNGPTIHGFVLDIRHTAGAHSHLSATKANRMSSRELRLLGSAGSYVSDFSDVQYEAITRGERPAGRRDRWGREQAARWGVIRTADGDSHVPSAQGDYTVFYDEFAGAISTATLGPVPASEGIEVLRILDAAVDSDARRCTILLETR